MISLPAAILVVTLITGGAEPRAMVVDAPADAAARLRLFRADGTIDLEAGAREGEARVQEIFQAKNDLKSSDFEAARLAAAQAARRWPSGGPAWATLGLALFRGGRAAEAVPVFARAAELDPASPTVKFNLASALLAAGRAQEAEPIYEQAALDADLAPLALLDAGLAADDAGAPDRAAGHLRAAIAAAAKRPSAAPVAARARELLDELAGRRSRAARARVTELAHAGRAALDAGRALEAARAYRAALTLAQENLAGNPAEAQNPSGAKWDSGPNFIVGDAGMAELEYGLGQALLASGDLPAAAAAFAAATRLAPREADFHYMLGAARLRAADPHARDAFQAALDLGLSGAAADRARGYIKTLTRAGEPPRFTFDVRAGGGYDSDVPQSSTVVSEPTGPAVTSPGAAFLTADVDLFYRPFGTTRTGVQLEYHFGQLAYLSGALDPYSLQEHDLSIAGALTVRGRVKLEAGVDGYLLFSGVAGFGLFQAGVTLGPRITVDEGHGLETRVKYVHTFKSSLDPNYDYLGGGRDEASCVEQWRTRRMRLAAGYTFTREAIGQQQLPLGSIIFPLGAIPLPADDVYAIPYSYFGHEVAASAQLELPWRLRAQLGLRYEHRDYDGQSYIFDPFDPAAAHRFPRARVDDRYTVDATLRRQLRGPFEVELAYTLVVNTSNIDFTNPQTPYDYDNKNYLKHVVAVEFSFLY